jgi:hypothetical protein
MSEFQQRNNSGQLYINDKGDNERRPDRQGTAMIGGAMYKMSGWIKQRDGKDDFLSLSFTPMEEPQQQQPRNETSHVDNGGEW